jgi:DNA-directed RNA polymerase subunit RPC12/RpoP
MEEKEKIKNTSEYVCSSCGASIGVDDSVCAKCGAEITEEVSHKEDQERIVVIKTFLNEFEAELAKAQLEDEGIECFLSSDDEGAMAPNLRFTQGVRLHIFENSVEKALQILDSYSKE